MNNDSTPWWKGAALYQVYPRSFNDTNSDGIGDLAGITEKIAYINSLGVDAIWISPFFKSPMRDFGYDISNYKDVDPIFGSIDDFDTIVAKAHHCGLKVLIDLVISHTSSDHPWFLESQMDKTNQKADWYIWADPKTDGTPPNNWLSLFGGGAWTWNPRRRQYYFHNFLSSQPDLNFRNPEVIEQLLSTARFWLDKGVDGFRLDVSNLYYCDEKLRDNPPRKQEDNRFLRERGADGITRSNPYSFQQHIYDKTQPENVDFFINFRKLLNEYGDTTTIGEISSDNSAEVVGTYTSGNEKLHMAYTFELLTTPLDSASLRQRLQHAESYVKNGGWNCWSLSNHDVVRSVSRDFFGPENLRPQRAKQLLTLLTCLRGSFILYQGEELGLPEVDIAFEEIQDPYGLPFWPQYKGRDGCRTPMAWDSRSANLGFSDVSPWLCIGETHRKLCVNEQELSADSVLNFTRKLLAWRRKFPSLCIGDIEFPIDDERIFTIKRKYNNEVVISLFNLSLEKIKYDASRSKKQWGITGDKELTLISHELFETQSLEKTLINIEPYDAVILISKGS